MADNTTLSAPSGAGDTIRDKDRAGVKTPIVAIDLNPAGGETLMAGKMPGTIADGDSATLGAKADAAVTDPASAASVIALLKGILTELEATLAVSAASLPLPSGASTAANQATEIVGLAAILGALQGTLTVSVSALPSGLATSAQQDTGNTSLASIDGKLTACNTGNVTIGAALPAGTNKIGGVTIADGDHATFGAQADAAAGTDTAAASYIGLFKRLLQRVTTLIGQLPTSLSNGFLKVSLQESAVSQAVTQATATNLKTQAEQYVGGTAVGNANPVPVSDAGGSLTVDGTVAVTSLTQLNGVAVTLNKGASDAGTQRVTLGDSAQVIGAVTQSGTWNIGTVTTVTTVSDAQAQGKAAEDAVASGNPVLTGLVARRARITAMSADGDVVRATGDRYGRTQVVGVALTVTPLQVTASGDTDLVAAPGAGGRLKLLRVEASNSHATTAVTAGLKTASLASGAVFGKKYLPAAGGLAVWTFPGGHLECGDAEKLVANLSSAGQVEMTAYYETILT